MVDSINRTLVVVVNKLSSSQLLDFIRSEQKGDLLHYLLVLRCSMYMLWCLSMPSMPYSSMHMPKGWNELSMPTEGWLVCMPIVIINFKVRGVKQDSHSHIWWRLYLPTFLMSVGLLTLMYIDSLIILAKPWSSFPMMLKFSGLVLCPAWVLCPWLGEGSLRCSLYLSPKVLDVSPMHYSSHNAPHIDICRWPHSFFLKDPCL